MDLVDFFAGSRPWWEFQVLLNDLPAASRYLEAQKNDPMIARAIAEQSADGPSRKWSPRAAEWDTQHELMASFFDRLGGWLVQHANSNRKAGSPPVKALPPFPRPKTGIDRARAAIDAAAESELDGLIARAHDTYNREQGVMDRG